MIDVELSAVFESLILLQHACEPNGLGSLLDLVVTNHELTVKQIECQ